MASTTGHRPLQGKLAIVTGASRGIGDAIARNLAAKGASLVLNYTSPSSEPLTTKLSESLQAEYGIPTLVVQADMGSPAGPLYLINTAKENFSKLTPDNSSFQIDIIINNAGISINQAISDVTIDAYESTYRINVLGPLLLMQAAEQYLPHDRSGRIVNLSSVSSTLGFVTQSVYGGSKAALEAMTRTWARELASRATVNAVNPGPVSTEMWGATAPEFKAHLKPFIQATPMAQIRPGLDDEKLVQDADAAGGRPGYPEEIAGVVGMLCSAESVWCTGQVVCANGGMRFLM